jgi:hypothetical protein
MELKRFVRSGNCTPAASKRENEFNGPHRAGRYRFQQRYNSLGSVRFGPAVGAMYQPFVGVRRRFRATWTLVHQIDCVAGTVCILI